MAELPIGWLGERGGTPLAAGFLRVMASHLRGGTLIVVDPDGTRRFGHGPPGERLSLAVDDFDGDELIFAASMSLTRRPAGRVAQGRLLWRFPLMTLRVSLGIYRQALALKAKGVPVHHHPDKVATPVTAPPTAGPER